MTTYANVFALQGVAPGDVLISDTFDVQTNSDAQLFVNVAKLASGVPTLGPVTLRVETNPAENIWLPIASFDVPAYTSTSYFLNGSHPSGSTVLNLYFFFDTIKLRELVFIRNYDVSNPASFVDSEFARAKATSGSTLTLDRPCLYDHNEGGDLTPQVYTEAVQWIVNPKLFSATNFRVVVDASRTDESIAVQAFMSK